MMRSAPFARAKAMFAALAAGMKAAGNDIRKRMLVRSNVEAELGPYESRGKGCGGYQASRRCVAHDKRDAQKKRNQQRHKRHA